MSWNFHAKERKKGELYLNVIIIKISAKTWKTEISLKLALTSFLSNYYFFYGASALAEVLYSLAKAKAPNVFIFFFFLSLFTKTSFTQKIVKDTIYLKF